MQDKILTVTNLSKHYVDFVALSHISFDVTKGEVFGIFGKSGSGKSTLMRCLNLLEQPQDGDIVFNGSSLLTQTPTQLKACRRQIGVIFQHFNLLESKTVFANIAFPLILTNASRASIATQVHHIVELVGLTAHIKKYPAELSGGQKQRVGIARALVTNPLLLLSDEATSALDTQSTAEIMELLLSINRELGLSIVLITHELAVVRKLCDQIAILDNGQIIEQGSAVDVLLHPRSKIARSLIIEEEIEVYLQRAQVFYSFSKEPNKHLLLLSFIGAATYLPTLSTIANYNIQFSILHGELGMLKTTPFGQLLVEFDDTHNSLVHACNIMTNMGVQFEVIF
jgi:D-methionine transport system ATP-binding protein